MCYFRCCLTVSSEINERMNRIKCLTDDNVAVVITVSFHSKYLRSCQLLTNFCWLPVVTETIITFILTWPVLWSRIRDCDADCHHDYHHGCVLIGQCELTNENAIGNRRPRSLPTFIYDYEFAIRVLVLCFTKVTWFASEKCFRGVALIAESA